MAQKWLSVYADPHTFLMIDQTSCSVNIVNDLTRTNKFVDSTIEEWDDKVEKFLEFSSKML